MAEDTKVITRRRRLVNKGKLAENIVKMPPFLKVCPVCQVPFYTVLPSQIYCSRRCRSTAAMRRYRSRKKEGMGDVGV